MERGVGGEEEALPEAGRPWDYISHQPPGAAISAPTGPGRRAHSPAPRSVPRAPPQSPLPAMSWDGAGEEVRLLLDL